jgi:chaperonin cofactor prefoldin
MEEKYAELEKRVKILEEMLKGFLQSEGNEIHIQLDHCQGDLIVGDNCDINLTNCPVGAVIPSNMEDSEALLDEIEDRIDELDSEVDRLENRIDDAENRAEQLKLSLD